LTARLDPERLASAVALVTDEHADRPAPKADDVPYLNHLLQVAGIVLAYGGDEDQTVAALCHDLVEDTDVTPAELAELFGPRVRDIVVDCTDTLPGDSAGAKSPWRARKEAYLSHMADVAGTSLLVAACDKVANVESLVRLVRSRGYPALQNFNAGLAEQIWFYATFASAVAGRVPPELEDRLLRGAAELAALGDALGDHPSTSS
jgi:GTP pyrophosphokinase